MSEQDIDAFIAKESRYHPEGLTREQAIRYMGQRAYAAAEETDRAQRVAKDLQRRVQTAQASRQFRTTSVPERNSEDSSVGLALGVALGAGLMSSFDSSPSSDFSGGGGDFGGGGSSGDW